MSNGHLGSSQYFPHKGTRASPIDVSIATDIARARDAANHQYRVCRGVRLDGKPCGASVGYSGYCVKHKGQMK